MVHLGLSQRAQIPLGRKEVRHYAVICDNFTLGAPRLPAALDHLVVRAFQA